MILLGIISALWAAEGDYIRGQELPNYNLNLLHTSMDSKRLILNEETALLYKKSTWFRIGFRGQGAALSYIPFERDQVDLVASQGGVDIILGHTFKKLRVAALLPFYVNAIEGSFIAPGDINVDLKYNFLSRKFWGYGIALSARAIVPTGPKEAALSDDGVHVETTAIFEKNLGRTVLAANLGFRTQNSTTYENFTWGNHLKLGAGLSIPIDLDLESLNMGSDFSSGVSAEVATRTQVASILTEDATITELGVAGWLSGKFNGLENDLMLKAGGTYSLTETPGSTGMRIILDATYKF